LKQVSLDSTDIEILKILTYDSRTSYNSMASVLNLSVNTIKNRIRRILASKAIEGFLTMPNLAIFGFEASLTVIVRHDGNAEQVVDRMSKLGYLYMRIDLFGNILTLKIFFKNKATMPTNLELQNLLKPNEVVRVLLEDLHADFKPSLTDWKLIHSLVSQPRIRVVDLAKKASVTEKTVIRRLEAMAKKRILEFTVQYNPAAMNNYHYFRLAIIIEPLLEDQVVKEIHKLSEDHFMSVVPPRSEGAISVILFAKNIPEMASVTKKIESAKGVFRVISNAPVGVHFFQKYLLDKIDERITSFDAEKSRRMPSITN
jgi:DNA-binding Lrp family transcriptional regulator